ncbi:MAG TPA: response regulator transcription factor [Clostridia bacterium]|nr:response regulator transcription factor [Clostridia bacterium]HRX43447.1 response regulator transcription factor [Clostridia bacterium]
MKENLKTILVVDDDDRIRKMVSLMLGNRGYAVFEASNGREGLQAFAATAPDMVILDVMMPVMDGIACLHGIRRISDCPVIMLTAKGEDYDQVEGLEGGADDYIIKPFSPAVLAARIEVLFRRSEEKSAARTVFGDLRIDEDARMVYAGGLPVVLNRKEFDLIKVLADNDRISLSRDQLLEKVWGYDYLGSDSTVDTHINRLRSKLGECGDYIKTVRGYGYKFEV